jgi:hypothetical protein
LLERGGASQLASKEESQTAGEKKERAMSSSNEQGWSLDRWWPALVILFGLIFVSVLISFKPSAY